MTEKYNSKYNNQNVRSKSRGKQLKCFICHKECQFKRDCPNRKLNKLYRSSDDRDAYVISDGYECAEVLNVSYSDPRKEWILDFRCSFTCALQDLGLKHLMH